MLPQLVSKHNRLASSCRRRHTIIKTRNTSRLRKLRPKREGTQVLLSLGGALPGPCTHIDRIVRKSGTVSSEDDGPRSNREVFLHALCFCVGRDAVKKRGYTWLKLKPREEAKRSTCRCSFFISMLRALHAARPRRVGNKVMMY
ncbi:hypothetical protein L209DRAFT_332343 [Thermothelomyces heterothallicus CBS 203.75]